ncbi:MAG: alpha-amylase family glycosyl hydrolase [Melioribacteraceae bacterium]|nr:alpha-amylase family glycosyl hydrolase [Melioribacteraceae bacterium]
MANKTIIVLALFITSLINGETLYRRDTFLFKSYKDTTEFYQHYKELDKYYSDKKLGSWVENGKTYFRIFAPSAQLVKVCIYQKVDDKKPKEYFMIRDEQGVWEVKVEEVLYNKFYGYKVYHKGDDFTNPLMPVCIDPYAKANASFTDYMNPRLSIVVKDEPYDWENDKWIQRDWEDLIIYEMHIRDMTAHKSSGAKKPGTYQGLIEPNIKGGLEYIKKLGVNTVELLPSQEFGYCEIPYKESLAGKFNTWNPYERNHWGYMTASFFAPASYYSTEWKTFKWKKWIGTDAKQIKDFKDMVKAFHKNGIAVIMDVVYNHLSEYEIGNLKQIDKEYYFRLDEKGNYIAESYCGNDLKTERPMVRRLIIESLIYWMKEYHIDGFRFDLGKLIDWETVEDISIKLRQINPNVIIVCEPWGGGYDPTGFSKRNWGAWNDQIRNGIKGENPYNGLGWIFGHWYGNNSPQRIKSYVNGTLLKDSLGLFLVKEHSVNYLESHDGYTLGDFIRIATKEVDPHKIIKDVDKHVRLTPLQEKINRLAALFLFTSQGITMIHSGQEFARSKVIPYNISVKDTNKGRIDHNSYEKDNETNYINFNHAEINIGLFNYYKGLIDLRKNFDAFRKANYEDIIFYEHPNSKFGLSYLLNYKNQKFVVLFNADQNQKLDFPLPEGIWEVLVDKDTAGIKTLYVTGGILTLEPISGAVLKLKE